MDEQIEHLYLALRSIREVDRLLIKTKNRSELLQAICDALIKNRSYYNAWIVVLDKSNKALESAQAGLGSGFLPMLERLRRGELTECARRALDQHDVVVVHDPYDTCRDCPLADKYSGRSAMTVRLDHEGKTYGLLCISIPKPFTDNEEELELLQEIAGDIAFGLNKIALEEALERNRTRAKELEQLVIIEDKMASLGHIAAGIAHEIRNPLSGINIYLNTLENLLSETEQPEMTKKILDQIQSASRKIELIIKRVIDFSRPSEPRFSLTDINKPVEEAIELSSVTMRKRGIKIKRDLAGDLPQCYIDPTLIEEVVLNLITNAAEAMKNSEGDKLIEVASGMENEHVFVRVSDSGPGIPPELRTKILEPFYTTKKSGSGIGLSLCHRIVTDHGGKMAVKSSRWSGAEFVVKIPVERKQ